MIMNMEGMRVILKKPLQCSITTFPRKVVWLAEAHIHIANRHVSCLMIKMILLNEES